MKIPLDTFKKYTEGIISATKHFFKKEKKSLQEDAQVVGSFISEEALLIKQRVEAKKAKQKKLRIIFGSLIALVILFAGLTIYSQYQLETLSRDELLADIPKEKQPKTGEEIIKALGRHVKLPEGVPQIAEIKDVSRLKTSQAFFEHAENGDYVVVYDSTIYLYRPSQDILISYGDISNLEER